MPEEDASVKAVEEKLAALEGAERALCFGSGMAAVSSLFLSQLKHGDHIVATRDLDAGTHEFLTDALPRWGIDVTLIPTNETRALDRAIRFNTRLVFTETPTNPLLTIVDLEAVAAISRRHGVPCAVDNTFASPINQRPIAFGFDFV
ncbi:MAG TPA: aminotransferase class I/II-fold pyridoxal phosphate-dependent enzyme, partial [Planctomycetota bacterium]|nr:aminotransferase class I/II-fold pyridoxal phosphate-dependent enzyme [Planctomycetota bacterium]